MMTITTTIESTLSINGIPFPVDNRDDLIRLQTSLSLLVQPPESDFPCVEHARSLPATSRERSPRKIQTGKRSYGTLRKPSIVFTPTTPAELARFASKISAPVNDVDACWTWRGSSPDGYPVFFLKDKVVSASRLAYFIKYPGFDQTSIVLKKCNNSICVNPMHMFTQAVGE